jgi:hypothetical protein
MAFLVALLLTGAIEAAPIPEAAPYQVTRLRRYDWLDSDSTHLDTLSLLIDGRDHYRVSKGGFITIMKKSHFRLEPVSREDK